VERCLLLVAENSPSDTNPPFSNRTKTIMGKYTNYDCENLDGLDVEVVRTVVNPQFSDFPLDRFPHFWRSPFGKKDQRLYARKGHGEFFTGISSLAGKSGISNKDGLQKAEIDLAFRGIDARQKWSERAEYGSCFHLLVALHERGELRFAFGEHDWVEVVDDFIATNGFFSFRKQWIEDIQNDFHCYFKFKKESDVKVITTEVMAARDDWFMATPLDIIAEMTFNRKRIIANINLKTGDTFPFDEGYYFQTSLEAYLYNRQIEKGGSKHKYSLDGSFCWRPKTRAKTPGAYELSKNAINSYTEEDFAHAAWLVKRNKMYIPSTDSKIVTFHGDESNNQIIIRTPYEWLAQMNGEKSTF
jgi:hypothetical protein